MSYKFLEDIAIADVAFEASGKSLEELMESSALAVMNTMVKDLKKIEPRTKKEIRVEGQNPEFLLFNFLQEIIFYKDAEQLLLGKFSIKVNKNGKYSAICEAWGEKLDMKKHELVDDIKAVSWHDFKVEKIGKGWKALVILDV